MLRADWVDDGNLLRLERERVEGWAAEAEERHLAEEVEVEGEG